MLIKSLVKERPNGNDKIATFTIVNGKLMYVNDFDVRDGHINGEFAEVYKKCDDNRNIYWTSIKELEKELEYEKIV